MEFEGVTRSLQHFVFQPRQPHLTELHCQNLVLITVAKEARLAATHATKQQQAPVVQTSDSAIHRINHYPADSVIDFRNTYPLDSDLSGG